MPNDPLPLAGVRIIDLTLAIAGPTATSILSDLGAEVLRVENINARANELQRGRSAGTHQLNRGKKSVVLNLATPKARDVFLRLVRISDVVIENFSPRVMPKFGLTYDVLAAAEPRIIMISMPAFGSTGPYAQRTGYGPGTNGMSGLSHLTGFADGPPTKPGSIMGDFNAAFLSAYACMAALHARGETGKGRHIELAMREGETLLIGEYLVDATMNERSPMRQGNRHPSKAPHNVYPCAGDDAWVTIAVSDDAEWGRLRAALGDPEWARAERLSTVAERWIHQAEIDEHLSTWTRERTPYAALHALQGACVTSGAVLNARDLAEDPHYRARAFVQWTPTLDGTPIALMRPGYLFSDFETTLRPAPAFAEHNDYVFFELLGMSLQEVEQMEVAQATSREPVRTQRAVAP